MPNIAEKSKVFGGKGVVLSFTRAPDVFLYRELIPGTKKYRYKYEIYPKPLLPLQRR